MSVLYGSERFRYGGQSSHADRGCRALRGPARPLDRHEAERFQPCRLCLVSIAAKEPVDVMSLNLLDSK